MRRKFYTLDVFTDTALAGNPLAVVMDCDGLDTARMQAIAREFNLSETVFVLPPADDINTARIRIFTPARELPFAGHPTIGAAILLAELRAPEMLARHDVGLVLEEPVGAIACTVGHAPGRAARANFRVPRLPSPEAPLGDVADIARALGLEAGEIGFTAHAPSRFEAGVSFAFVPVARRAAVARIVPDLALWQAAFGGSGLEAVCAYCAEPLDPKHQFHARVFAPGMGIAEDPATGAAAAGLAGVLATFEALPDGEHTVVIEQGHAVGRPSLIVLGLSITDGRLDLANVGGSAVIVQQGTIDV